MTENIFAIIVPSEASMTATIAPSIELSKLFVMAANKVSQLAEQTRVRSEPDENGNVRTIVTDHPDLKWWFDQSRKIASDIAKLVAHVEGKNIENKLKVMDIFLNSPQIPDEMKEEYTRKALESRLMENGG